MMPAPSPLVLMASMVILMLSASPAAAADELGLSRDGTTWSSSIDVPLFEESIRWVPGDSRSAVFYVRNKGGTPGDLTIDVTSSRAGGLMASEDLRIIASGGGGTWTSVNKPGTRRLLSTPDIADSAVVPITVSVTFDASSINTTQRQATSLRFAVNLSESTGSTDGDQSGAGKDGGDGGLGGLLPDTGAPATWIVAVGALLVGIGAAMANRCRDREEVLLDV